MIVFDLQCRAGGERFEAWFRSNSAYEEQRTAGMILCPFCDSSDVEKAPMVPRLPAKASQSPLAQLARAQAEMLKNSRWVGEEFASTARAIHNGELDAQQVHGSATPEQAQSLIDDGIPIASLPLPVTPPRQIN